MSAYWIGNQEIGCGPRVVGTILDGGTLDSPEATDPATGDLVEARLDWIGADRPGWLEACRAIEAGGKPVIATLRIEAEGGRWAGPEAAREGVLAAALENLGTIDIESVSALRPRLCALAERLGKPIIVSCHHFDSTPPLHVLQAMVTDILSSPAAVPKLAAMVRGEQDIETLAALLASRGRRPMCVIGMGALGTPTRTAFARLGSCLTYGYLDRSAAPGQIPSRALATELRGT